MTAYGLRAACEDRSFAQTYRTGAPMTTFESILDAQLAELKSTLMRKRHDSFPVTQPSNNPGNGHLRDAVLSPDLALSERAAAVGGPDFTDLVHGQFALAIGGSSVVGELPSISCTSVGRVLQRVSIVKMGRVAARRVVALMKGVFIGEPAVCKQERRPMGINLFSARSSQTTIASIRSAHPGPASIRATAAINASPERFNPFGGKIVGCHLNPPKQDEGAPRPWTLARRRAFRMPQFYRKGDQNA